MSKLLSSKSTKLVSLMGQVTLEGGISIARNMDNALYSGLSYGLDGLNTAVKSSYRLEEKTSEWARSREKEVERIEQEIQERKK